MDPAISTSQITSSESAAVEKGCSKEWVLWSISRMLQWTYDIACAVLEEFNLHPMRLNVETASFISDMMWPTHCAYKLMGCSFRIPCGHDIVKLLTYTKGYCVPSSADAHAGSGGRTQLCQRTNGLKRIRCESSGWKKNDKVLTMRIGMKGFFFDRTKIR